MNIPDGLTLVMTANSRYGAPGDVKMISYSVALELIRRGLAKRYEEESVIPSEKVVVARPYKCRVTAICPTYNRRKYLPMSIACFLSQTYTDSELLIVDDSDQSVEDLVPKHPRIRYVRVERLPIWDKRNFCCWVARGEIIVHWDDDDWQAPGRIEDQVSQLELSGKSVLCYYNILYWDAPSKIMCRGIPGPYACHGATLCYYKSWWVQHNFEGAPEGEDTKFGTTARLANQLVLVKAREHMVTLAHPKDGEPRVDRGNTSVTADVAGKGCLPRAREIPDAFIASLAYSKSAENPIILIASCREFRTNGYDNAARETWIREWCDRIHYKFVLGRGCENPRDDEIVLDVADGYETFPYKTRAARLWASENGYGHSFHCCSDTYVAVPRLLASGFEKYDYCGHLMRDEHRLCKDRNVEFAQGGAGYWLSRKAGAAVIAAEIPDWVKFAEDAFVGDTLFNAHIPFTHDARYWGWGFNGGAWNAASVLTVHLSEWQSVPKYKTEWMRETHRRVQLAGV